MSAVTLTPSWVETTLRWIEENHPEYVSHARGAGPLAKLTNSLVKMSFRLAQCDGDRKKERSAVEALVATWDFDAHNNLRVWLAAGGYRAKVSATVPPAIVDTPDGPELIELEMPADEPAPAPVAAPAPVQTLDEVLADADDRYGAW